MGDEKYNGWANYPTWRVNLELFDGFDPTDIWPTCPEVAEMADSLKAIAEDHLLMQSEGLALSMALAFIDDVNWREIASHLIDGYYDEKGAP